MSTSPTAALVSDATSAVFSSLLDFLKTKAAPTAIQSALTAAGVPVDVATMITSAITQGGQVKLPNATSHKLGELLDPFLPSGVTVPTQWADIKLTLLTFTADPATPELSMNGGVTIPVSLAKLGSTNIDFTFNLYINGAVSPSFTAGLTGATTLTNTLANSQLQVTLDLTQASQSIDLEWVANTSGDYLQLSDLASLFDGTLPDFPDGLDFKLTKATAELDLSSTDDSLELSAVSDTGAAFILIDQVDGSWGLACGVALTTDKTTWPCISADLGGFTLILDAAELLLATADFPNFTWPAFDANQASAFSAFPFPLNQGIVIIAIADVSAESDGIPKTLLDLTKLRTSADKDQEGKLLLSAQLQVPLAFALTADFGGCKIKNYSFDLTLSITMGTDELDFAGNTIITFTNWNNTTADVSLNITFDSVYGAVTVSSPNNILSGTRALQGLTISQLSGLMGIDAENQEIILGFVAQFALGSITAADTQATTDISSLLPSGGLSKTMPQPNAGEIAIIVGLNDDAILFPVPDVDFLLLRLTQVDLGTVIKAVYTSVSTDALTALTNIQLDDILLYWCDVPTGTYVLPDSMAPVTTGFMIHGLVDFSSTFKVWAELGVDATAGFNGSLYFPPITLGDVLSISGDDPPPNTAPSTFTSGGPWVTLSTAASPFLSGNLNLQILEVGPTDIEVTITGQTFQFSIKNTDASLFTDDFACTLTADSAQISLQITVNGNLVGDVSLPAFLDLPSVTLHLNTQYNVNLSVALSNGTPTFSVNGSFVIGSESITLPTLTVNASISHFADIPGAILKVINDNAATLFQTAVNDATTLWNTWKDDVLDHIEEGVHDVVYLLLHIHHSHENGEPWLKTGNLVVGDGTNYYQLASDDAAAMGSNFVRRLVPDNDTLVDLRVRCNFTVVNVDPTNPAEPGSQLLIDALPIDTLTVPSRINGTIVSEFGTTNVYLIAWSPAIDSGRAVPGVPGKYRIDDPDTFLQASGKSSSQWCDGPDIREMRDNSVLSTSCAIIADHGYWAAFVDGVSYAIPDPYTGSCLNRSFQKAQTLDGGTFASIPSGPSLAQLKENDLAQCGAKVYLVQKSQLRWIQCMPSLTAYETYYSLDFSQAVQITPLQESIMNQGDSMPISPPGMKITC